MHDKYTELVTLAPAGLTHSPQDGCVAAFNVQNYALREHRPNRLLPAPGPNEHFYLVSPQTIDACFHIPGAIACTRPDGAAFHPGMSLRLQFRYTSPTGLQQLLRQTLLSRARVPELITLEALYDLLLPEMSAICARKAREFSGAQTLPYSHWWNDIRYGTAFRDEIFKPLWQLFFSYGFDLDRQSFAICGLAPVPMA
ncbi:MAG: hypothetical protein IKK57_07795 [Clostridia bacterium]|nr:hypothetical protein [Clostridia bacterium]